MGQPNRLKGIIKLHSNQVRQRNMVPGATAFVHGVSKVKNSNQIKMLLHVCVMIGIRSIPVRIVTFPMFTISGWDILAT